MIAAELHCVLNRSVKIVQPCFFIDFDCSDALFLKVRPEGTFNCQSEYHSSVFRPTKEMSAIRPSGELDGKFQREAPDEVKRIVSDGRNSKGIRFAAWRLAFLGPVNAINQSSRRVL